MKHMNIIQRSSYEAYENIKVTQHISARKMNDYVLTEFSIRLKKKSGEKWTLLALKKKKKCSFDF